MATDYPTGLDSFDEPSAPTTTALGSAGDTSPARDHNTHHRDLGDAIEAVQAELGLSPSGVFSTVKARLDGLLLHARATRTSGDLTLNSTSWANVDTGMDLTLSAAAGDWVEVAMSGLAGGSTTVGLVFDVVSMVSGSPVNSWGHNAAPDNAHLGITGLYNLDTNDHGIHASIIRQLVSGDISGGNVTLRLRYRTQSAANRTLYAQANMPLVFWARNHRAT